jgi:PKD repeat protein
MPSGDIVAWYWDFGDGANSDLQNPDHVFNTKGDYFVTLTVTSNEGVSDSTTGRIWVGYSPPIASFDFTPSSPNIDEPVSFTDLSSAPEPGDSIVSWDWQFGANATPTSSTEQDPTCTFQTSGIHSVWLTVTDSLGMIASTSQDISVP